MKKKDLHFIQWVVDTQPDPWRTMAEQTIIFDSEDSVESLKKKFGDLYGRDK